MSSDPRTWTVADHLDRGNDNSVALWHRFRGTLEEFGPVTLSVSKTTVTFKGSRRGFAGARPTPKGVVGYMDLTRELPSDPRVRSVAPYGKKLFVHQFVLRDDDDLDDTFAAWLREAYDVGCGAHLSR